MNAADDARLVSARLSAIRKLLAGAVRAQAAAYPVPLTGPQVQMLELLVDEVRHTGAGLSVSELSRRMGLAHSTVSGIATRLGERELVRRAAHPDDRRFVRIELTDAVRKWLEEELPGARLAPLADALRSASKRDRAAAMDGLDTLERLLREHPKFTGMPGERPPAAR